MTAVLNKGTWLDDVPRPDLKDSNLRKANYDLCCLYICKYASITCFDDASAEQAS